jgi:hypothetical protein
MNDRPLLTLLAVLQTVTLVVVVFLWLMISDVRGQVEGLGNSDVGGSVLSLESRVDALSSSVVDLSTKLDAACALISNPSGKPGPVGSNPCTVP